MSLNLVSPGVKVREVDLTIGNISGAQEQVGAIAGPFEKGPIDVPILVENEQDLIATYGKPLDKDGQFEYWMTASSYLSYGGTLRVLRSDSSNLNNANAGVSVASTDIKIKSYDDYTSNTYTTFYYAAKNPGTWGNGLKVFTIDHFADQVISGISTTGISVGMGVTQSIKGRVRIGSGTTTSYGDEFVRGIITGVGTAGGVATDAITVKIVDRVTSAGVLSATTYDELKFLSSTTTTTTSSSSVGIGTTAGTVDLPNDITIDGITVSSAGGGMNSNIQLGDVVTVTGGNSTVAAGTTVIGISTTSGIGTVTVDRAITGVSTSGDGAIFTFTRTTTSSSTNNLNQTFIINDSGVGVSTFTSTTASDWYNQQTLGLTKGGDISWNTIAEKPGTSEYAESRGGSNDEIHIVVIDEDGSSSGVAGNILEKHLYLSKAKDGKRQPAEEVYYKNYLANRSELIFNGAHAGATVSGLTAKAGNASVDDFNLVTGGAWGQNASGVTFNVEGNRSYDLTGGKDYSGTDGYLIDKGDVINSYNILKNPAEYSINFILQGPSGGATIFDSQAKASALIGIANLRKDCIACISPHRAGVVNIPNSDTQTDNIVDYYAPLQSSSYAVFDSGYKYTFDRFNNEFRYIPLNGDIGGLMARTSINSFSWFSPAGASRGAINGAIKLAYNPTQAQRDIIYPKRINPVIASPGAGIILFGDRTGLGVASAFDRINVRRLFLTIEDTIERAARDQLFEFNDVITRTNFLNIVDPFLRDVKAKRGITEFVVICDETNNTPDIIDSNQFRADIFVKPARSINFIGLTFVATRTGVSFEEVVGNV